MAKKSQPVSNKLSLQAVARAVGAAPVTIKRYAEDGIIRCERINFGSQQVRMFDPDQIPIARAEFEKNTKNAKRQPA